MAATKAEQASGPQEQLANQPMVSQQYVVTINGDISGQHPPVNLKAIGVTATLQLISAALVVAFGVMAILALCIRAIDGLSIWTGLAFFMVAGILGRVAVRKKNNCTIIAYMVLSILSALASSSLVLSILPVIFLEGPTPYEPIFDPPLKLSQSGRMAINVAIVAIAAAEGIIAIVAAAFCCRGTCCAPPRALQIQYSPAVPSGSFVVPQDGQAITMPQGRSQTIVINPTPPASYQPGSHPDPNSAMMPPPAYVVSAPPPAYQTNTTQQAGDTANGHQGAVGRDATEDDGTDQQALVM
ncbi:uncharacterized protein [Amphiura filiformis]|uniref:uncharacterized protein n=1 Tax=Amphiura filiformis TaxID=82378 RepID=UPI003B2266CA